MKNKYKIGTFLIASRFVYKPKNSIGLTNSSQGNLCHRRMFFSDLNMPFK